MIVLYHEGRERFEAITSWMERLMPKAERWRWDAAIKRWYATDEDIARRLGRYAQGTAALRLNTTEADRQAIADSMAHDAPADIDIPVPPGLEYLPFQRAGILYALKRKGTLMGCEMGLGKTVMAIGVVNMLPQAKRVLIVCPASLRLNWQAEWRRWHAGKLRPVLLDEWPGGLLGNTAGLAMIVSYDSVAKWHPMIAADPYDVLIADEIHLCKDEGIRRSKALFGGDFTPHKTVDGERVAGPREHFEPIKARRKVFLTGTAIVNKAADLWPIVKALAPAGLGASRVDFLERYAGNDRLGELHLRLRTQIMVRRKKEDVLKDLPAKRRQIVLLDVVDAEGILAAESQAISFAKEQLERARAEIAGLPHGEQVMRLRQCRAIAMTEISRVRKETAIKKLPAAIEHIKGVIENGIKVVGFAHHHQVLDGLRAAFPKAATGFDGRTSLPDRQAAVERFQADPQCRIFIGSKAAGLGVTLTAASVAVFVEMQWTAADMDQEESRIHRIGQREPCLFQHLVIDGSIDSKMAKIIIGKQAIMDQALDGGTQEMRDRDILDEVLRA